jgi:hypothetical protein
MIITGRSTSLARQLARNIARAAPGESFEVLELQSPWASPDYLRLHPVEALVETFRDWQLSAGATSQSRKGLYHASLSPEPCYAGTMTAPQWLRAADILGEELGLQGQERALVQRQAEDRGYLHAVWQRTDLDTWKLISDSFNYKAHERASRRIEQEFGHAPVHRKGTP